MRYKITSNAKTGIIKRIISGCDDIMPKLTPLFQTGVRLKNDVMTICCGISNKSESIHFLVIKSTTIITIEIAANRI
jgi:hypothetical protein